MCVPVNLSIELKFNSFELDSEVGRLVLNLSECVGILSSVTLIGLMDRQGAVNSSGQNGYAAGWHLVFGNYSCISYYFLKLKFIVWLNRLKNPPSCRRQSI